jgi:polyhydroxyalkanoate synthesis regulator phasin
MVRREDIRAMQDAWRAYLDLALGLTETSRKKATKVARKLVGRGNATAEQLQSMAEDLVSTSLANREALVRLVRFELERALGRVGLATADEVTALTARVRELEEQLEAARDGRAPAASSAPAAPPVKAAPVKKAVARKTVAKKTAAPVTPEVTEVVAAVADPVPARKVAVKRTPVKKAVAKKAVAKKAPAPVGEQ